MVGGGKGRLISHRGPEERQYAFVVGGEGEDTSRRGQGRFDLLLEKEREGQGRGEILFKR